MLEPDPIGQAVHNYHFKQINKPVIIYSDEFDEDEVLPSYFFRRFVDMPALERKALEKAKGRILDVGACAGCHALYLQEKGHEVVALERSALSCEVLKARGIQQVLHQDLFLHHDRYDTLLLLMNGTGIAGTLASFESFLRHLSTLLKPDGQILIDSSDLIYLYTEEDGSALIDINAEKYYGELTFQTEYNKQKGKPFPWLYVGLDLMKQYAEKAGLKIESVDHGEHYDYLATLKKAVK